MRKSFILPLLLLTVFLIALPAQALEVKGNYNIVIEGSAEEAVLVLESVLSISHNSWTFTAVTGPEIRYQSPILWVHDISLAREIGTKSWGALGYRWSDSGVGRFYGIYSRSW